MADIRIKDLATTATTTASDDFMAVDGAINGTRKLSAATPAFLTSVTTPSLTSPAATNLTLAGGAGNSSIILTPAGTGGVGIGTASPREKLEISGASPVLLINNTSGGTNVKNFYLSNTGGNFGINLANDAYTGFTNLVTVTNSGNVGIGTADMTGLTGAGGLKIASTTAGSSGAGALVVTGGISAGQSAQASYFGGAVTTGALTVSSANLILSAGYELRFGAGGNDRIYQSATSGGTLVFDAGGATRLSLNSTAATFAGAVTVASDLTVSSNITANSTGSAVGNFNSTAVSGAAVRFLQSGAATSYVGSSKYAISNAHTTSDLGLATVAGNIYLAPSGTVALTLATTGAATFAGAVTIGGTVIHTLSATPASASATGTVGTMSWDASYIYICTAANTWKRVAIATW